MLVRCDSIERYHERQQHAHPDSNCIDISPITLRLGMHGGVPVNFTSTRQQNPRLDTFSQAKHINGAHGRCLNMLIQYKRGMRDDELIVCETRFEVYTIFYTHTHLDGFHGIVLIVRRTGGARQMIDLIHLEEDREGDVVPNEGEVGMVKPVLDVRLPPREEIIQHHHLVSLGHETVDQMRPHEAGTAGDQDLLPQGVGQAHGADDAGCVGGGDGLRREELLVGHEAFEALAFGFGVVRRRGGAPSLLGAVAVAVALSLLVEVRHGAF